MGHGLHMLHDSSVYAFEHNYALEAGGFVYSDEHFVAPDSPVFVLEPCTLRLGGRVASDGDWRPLDEVLRGLGGGAIAAAAAASDDESESEAAVPAPESDVPLWVTHPWLMADWAALGHTRKGRLEPRLQTPAVASEETAPRDDWSAEGFTAEEAMAELEALRARWACDEHRAPSDFKVRVRGGAYTAARMGVAADASRGEAANQEAEAFCVAAGLPRSATFNFLRYTEEHARDLARAWCHRLQWWFDLWMERGGEGPPLFAPEDAAQYQAPQWVADLPAAGNHFLGARLAELARIEPRFA